MMCHASAVGVVISVMTVKDALGLASLQAQEGVRAHAAGKSCNFRTSLHG